MEKELQNQLASILAQITESVQKTGSFVLEQLPDVIHQWMTFTIIQNILIITTFFIICFLSYMATFKWSNQERDYFGDWSASKGISLVAGVTFTTISGIGAVRAIVETLQIIYAPKVWVIQNIANLLK